MIIIQDIYIFAFTESLSSIKGRIIVQGQTWKNLDSDSLKKIKIGLLEMGGENIPVKNEHEIWRVKISDSVFTAYKKGTLYSTPSNSNSKNVLKARTTIDQHTGTGYLTSEKSFLIGFDETGKGEIAGPIILAGAAFPTKLFSAIVKLIGPADTKKSHNLKYWQELFYNIAQFRISGFFYSLEIISPALCDKYNINNLLDLFYKKLIIKLKRQINKSNFRLVLDDYNTGKSLESYLTNFSNKNEIIIVTQAEDTFIEAKTASIISKYFRESILYQINNISEYKIDNSSIGLGNVGNPKTLKWIQNWKHSRKSWPWFIKQSFKTIEDLENTTNKVKKIRPVLRDELLSHEFIRCFEEGKKYIHLLALKCPSCNEFQRSINFNLNEWICPNCFTPFENISLTMRYYCSDVIPDLGTITKKAISKDLENRQYFENYKIYISKDLINENLSSGEMKELNNLVKLNQLGRLKLEYYDGTYDNQNIIKLANLNNALIMTSSQELNRFAMDNNIFTIFLKQ